MIDTMPASDSYPQRSQPDFATMRLRTVGNYLSTTDQTEYDSALSALSVRRTTHDGLLSGIANKLNLPDGTSRSSLNSDGTLYDFTVSDKDRTPALLPEQVAAMGLPKPMISDKEVLLGLVGTPSPDGLASLQLLIKNEYGGLRILYLQDQDVQGSSRKLDAEWTHPGDRFIPSVEAEFEMKSNGSVVVVQPRTPLKEGTFLIRSTPNDLEQKLTSLRTERKNRRGKLHRLFGAAAIVGGLTAGSGLLMSDQDTQMPPRVPGTEVVKPEVITSDADALASPILIGEQALARYHDAIREYKNGNVAALQEMVAGSEFAQQYVSQQGYEAVESAETVENIIAATNAALADVGVTFDVPHNTDDSVYKKFTVFDTPDVQLIRQAALGVLDIANNYAPLMKALLPLQVEAVDTVIPSGAAEHARAHFSYSTANIDGIARIRYAVGDKNPDEVKEVIAENAVHELAHGGDSDGPGYYSQYMVADLNPSGTYYGTTTNSTDLTKTLRIGEEVASDYGRTNYDEDTAEVIEAFSEGSGMLAMIGDTPTVLGAKAEYLMTSLEEHVPGITAKFLLGQERAYSDLVQQPSFMDKMSETIKSGLRTSVRYALFGALASAAAGIFAYRKEKSRDEAKKRLPV